MIKAIETVWKGWKFRSRCEARWAVFLDACNVKFEYEHEGVILPDGPGTPYLPDFWIPNYGIFIEIKGAEPTLEERRRCFYLSATGHAVLLLIGNPGPDYTGLFYGDASPGDFKDYGPSIDEPPAGEPEPFRFTLCRGCRGLTIALLNEPVVGIEDPSFLCDMYGEIPIGCADNCNDDRWTCEEPTKALVKARQARFESFSTIP